jgi:hypothetical protein
MYRIGLGRARWMEGRGKVFSDVTAFVLFCFVLFCFVLMRRMCARAFVLYGLLRGTLA